MRKSKTTISAAATTAIILILITGQQAARAYYYNDSAIYNAGGMSYAESVQGAPSLRHFDTDYQVPERYERRNQTQGHEPQLDYAETRPKRIYYGPERPTIFGN